MNPFPTIFIILFLFLIKMAPAHANTHEYSPDSVNSNSSPTQTYDKIKENQLTIANPPNLKTNNDFTNEIYTYTQSLSTRIGFLYDIKSNDPFSYAILGATYMFPQNKSPQHEIGADIITNGKGFLHWGKKFIHKERSFFRYYYKYGLNHYLVPSDGLASFVNYKNYLLLLNAGLESVISLPTSYRLDATLSVGTNYIFLSLYLGLTWGW